MKKLLTAVTSGVLVALVLLALRGSAPAQAAQDAAVGQDLAARVTALEGELAQAKQRQAETQALLAETLSYLEKQSRAAQALLAVLDESEREGFAVGENWRSRQVLLAGLRAYGSEAQGVPKAPAPAPKPAAPATPARAKAPARQ